MQRGESRLQLNVNYSLYYLRWEGYTTDRPIVRTDSVIKTTLLATRRNHCMPVERERSVRKVRIMAKK